MSAMTYQRPATAPLPTRPRRLPRTAVDPRVLVSAQPSWAVSRRSATAAGASTDVQQRVRRDAGLAAAPVAPRPAAQRHALSHADPMPGRHATPVMTTASPARLTRRGRVVVVLLVAAVALVLFSLGRASSSSATAGGRAAAPRPTTVVQHGDTLWSIARRIAPGSDPRVTVERLADLNDLGGRPIQPGQTLTLPYAGS